MVSPDEENTVLWVAVLLLPLMSVLLVVMDRVEDRLSGPAPAGPGRGMPPAGDTCAWSGTPPKAGNRRRATDTRSPGRPDRHGDPEPRAA
ncbi:hypothetical protein [Streptomyces sp. NPDC088812]|uniref:hypothetical protein n=1 Tax=Streptomyces sp. NPDC088812 TaxID=3365905 RepID=UPI0038242F89